MKKKKPHIRVATIRAGDDEDMAEILSKIISKETEVLAVVPSGMAFKFILRDGIAVNKSLIDRILGK